MPSVQPDTPAVIIVGAGPAGLMAAEQVLAEGIPVTVCDAMPSPGRKFLLAGIGGLNLTHAEPLPAFLSRYGAALPFLRPALDAFGPQALRDWSAGLGVETFVGSSGRVFPREMKAAPLLRRWLQRLRGQGLRLLTRHRWLGWADAAAPGRHGLRFATPAGEVTLMADVVILALGGGSWARLGSDGAWQPWLAERGIALAPLRPANCGFDADWSDILRARAGEPLKPVALKLPWLADARPLAGWRKGECVLTRHGIEGGLVYALSAAIRDRIEVTGEAGVLVNLLPDHDPKRLREALAQPRGKLSLSRQLQRLGLAGARLSLLHELTTREQLQDVATLARLIQALPLRLRAPRPLDEAISTAGGVRLDQLDDGHMLTAMPGVFCCGEMLDWEAPTGGYLLTACFASGRAAGQGALAFVGSRFTAR